MSTNNMSTNNMSINNMSVNRKSWPLLIAMALGLSGAVIFCVYLQRGSLHLWDSLRLSVRLEDLAGTLAPLAFASAVVERAVEILVSPWRDAEASKLERVVAGIKARPVDSATNAQNAADLQATSDALDEYRGQTQRYAFGVSLTLSVLVSIAGVRALGAFADTQILETVAATPRGQHMFFICIDVALSAALLAGGADGIHSVVNAVTSFFDATAAKLSSSSS
jgi:hypothetical protein